MINYVKLFRHFADKNNNTSSCSQSTDTISTKVAESINEEEDPSTVNFTEGEMNHLVHD